MAKKGNLYKCFFEKQAGTKICPQLRMCAGSVLEELAARIWGRSVRDGQMVQKNYVMQDGDIAAFRI